MNGQSPSSSSYSYNLGGGSGSSDSGSQEDDSVEKAKQYTQCLSDVNSKHANCLTNTTLINAANTGCILAVTKTADRILSSSRSIYTKLAGATYLIAGTESCNIGRQDSLDRLPAKCDAERIGGRQLCDARFS